MKVKAKSLMQRRGRPTLEMVTANPFSTENIQTAALQAGITPEYLMRKGKQALEEIEKPEDVVSATAELGKTWMPYIAKKLANESESNQKEASQTINLINFTPDQVSEMINKGIKPIDV